MSFPPNLGITTSFIIVDSTSPSLFQEFPSLLLPQLDKLCAPFSRTKMTNGGYSKIQNKPNSSRSKSIDFADLSFSQYHSTSRSAPNFSSNSSRFKSISNADQKKTITVHASIPENDDDEEEGGGTGEVFGIILHRKCGDQKAAAAERESSSFQTAVKRSFSMKRSASVSEGYSRIHHKCDLADAEDDDPRGTEFTDQSRNVKKKGKFLKAVRKLFRL
ncbi:hypothetical protein ABFS83_03G119400 [Erythranthe nasuta]